MYKFFSVVLYWFESLLLTFRENHALRASENRALRGIFELRRDAATRGWRKLHNEELHNLYSSPSIIRINKSRKIRWARHVRRMERRMHMMFVEKPEGKRPPGRLRCRWVDNLKMDLRVVWCDMDWSGLSQDDDSEMKELVCSRRLIRFLPL
jgi:hypothetical protein